MSEDLSFVDLMSRLQAGDEEAARLIFQRFANRLIALARSRLNERLRQKVDPEDVMQSALKSFFLRQAAGQFELESWDSLWSLLTVITLRKCGARVEYFRAACRDLQREAQTLPASEDSSANWQAIAREPTPEEAALLADTVEEVFRRCDPDHRRILELSLQGWSIPEISVQVGSSERTVYRRLERIKGDVQRLRGDAPTDA